MPLPSKTRAIGIAQDQYVFSPTVQQPGAEAVFQRGNVFCRGGLREVQLLSGLAEAAALDDADEQLYAGD